MHHHHHHHHYRPGHFPVAPHVAIVRLLRPAPLQQQHDDHQYRRRGSILRLLDDSIDNVPPPPLPLHIRVVNSCHSRTTILDRHSPRHCRRHLHIGTIRRCRCHCGGCGGGGAKEEEEDS